MSEKLLKNVIYVGGLVSLLFFVAERSLPVYNFLLVEKQIPEHFEFTRYGEMYYFSRINDFKEDLPQPIRKFRLSEMNAQINQADMITFGDSYFDFSRQMTVPERLSRATGKKVHAIYSYYPIAYLNQIGYKPGKSKIFIYETAERMIPLRFGKNNKMSFPGSLPPKGIHKIDVALSDLFNGSNEERLDKLIKESYLTGGAYAQISTLRYHDFGYISQQSQALNTASDSWLFYGESVNKSNSSIHYQHSEDEIEEYCNNIQLLQKNLKEMYNLDFIFMSVPNKITRMRNQVIPPIQYNNLLPRVQKGLKIRGVPFVDLYSEFEKTNANLYYQTDTHWNKKGVDIAVEKILEHFDRKSCLNTH